LLTYHYINYTNVLKYEAIECVWFYIAFLQLNPNLKQLKLRDVLEAEWQKQNYQGSKYFQMKIRFNYFLSETGEWQMTDKSFNVCSN
jgi:hypothetical protein